MSAVDSIQVMTSHLPEPDERSSQTGTDGIGDGGPSDGRRFQMRIALIGAAGAIIAAAVGAVVSLKPWSHSGPSPSGGSASASTNNPSGTFHTHLGRSLTLTSDGIQATFKLTRIVDPAAGDNSSLTSGDRYVATEFWVYDPSAQPVTGINELDSPDVARAIGSNGQTYQPDPIDTVSECTSFHTEGYKIVSGESATGCIVFQIPIGVSVSEVQVMAGNELGIWSNP